MGGRFCKYQTHLLIWTCFSTSKSHGNNHRPNTLPATFTRSSLKLLPFFTFSTIKGGKLRYRPTRPQNCLTCPPLSQTCPPKRVNTIFRHFRDKNCVIKAFELGNGNTCMKNVHPTPLLCRFCWLWRKCLREHLYVGTCCRHYQNLMELTKIVHVLYLRGCILISQVWNDSQI